MNFIICAIYDKKAKEYQAPFAQPNKATATRSFMQACNEKDSLLSKFAEDYALYQVGYMDKTTGELKEDNQLLLEAENVVNKNA